MNIRMALATLLFAGCLAGCGTPPRLDSVTLPPVPADKARFFIFREPESSDRSPIWTRVSLNHHEVGSLAPSSVFYRDVRPGIYEIEVDSSKIYPHQFKTVFARPGSETFVEIESLGSWGSDTLQWTGTTFIVNIFDPAFGWQAMAPLRLIPG